VLEAQGISADEAALALAAAIGLAALKNRGTAAWTLRRLAEDFGIDGVATVVRMKREERAG
jgi:hypothetical protein